MFQRRKPIVAQRELTEGQHRQAEQQFWTESLRKQQNLNIFTLAGVIAAGAAFFVLLCTLRESRRQFELSERPWVGLGPITILTTLNHNQSLKIRATIQNGGKSPALYVRTRPVLLPAWNMPQDARVPLSDKVPECEQDSPKWNKAMNGTMVLPGPPERGFIADSGILLDSEVNFLNRGVPIEGPPGSVFGLYLVGCLDYFDDSLKTPYRTNYCRFYLPPTKDAPNGYFADCSKGNDAR